jgi:hypothetical protein
MTYTAEPAWGSTVDVPGGDYFVFEGLAAADTTNNNKPNCRNGVDRRGAE